MATIYISDPGNTRIIERNLEDLTYVSEFPIDVMPDVTASFLSGPYGICNDGQYLYTLLALPPSSHFLVKMNIGATAANLTYNSHIEVVSDWEPRAMCTDEMHLYYINSEGPEQPWRLSKHLCSDLSYVTHITIFNGSDSFLSPRDITTYGSWLYVCDEGSGVNSRLIRFLKADLSYVDELATGSDPITSVTNNGIYLIGSVTPRIV